MSKILIYLVIMIAILSGSAAHGKDKLELDTKTTLSIINTVMEFYYARHHGDADKIRAMLLKEQLIDNVDSWVNGYELGDEKKMEFIKLYISPKNPLVVGVVVRFSYGEKSPPWDDLIRLKKTGGQWKILELTAPGLP